jgi:hypothetical protein
MITAQPGRNLRVVCPTVIRLAVQQMQNGRLCGLKDDEPRIVPLLTSLAPILAAWKLNTGGDGLLFKPANPRHADGPT